MLKTVAGGPEDDVPEPPESKNDIVDISEIMGEIKTLRQWILELQKVNKYKNKARQLVFY